MITSHYLLEQHGRHAATARLARVSPFCLTSNRPQKLSRDSVICPNSCRGTRRTRPMATFYTTNAPSARCRGKHVRILQAFSSVSIRARWKNICQPWTMITIRTAGRTMDLMPRRATPFSFLEIEYTVFPFNTERKTWSPRMLENFESIPDRWHWNIYDYAFLIYDRVMFYIDGIGIYTRLCISYVRNILYR